MFHDRDEVTDQFPVAEVLRDVLRHVARRADGWIIGEHPRVTARPRVNTQHGLGLPPGLRAGRRSPQ